uniref:NADH dehydrogenase subunit 2 n=1 Tax=Volvocales sp. NrCl902 TaxID=2682054 RepID=A0A7G1GGB2_9CHLO|nr:NADH dehydrogenase subunit 2 [Volvocales sp. NrCl902]
MFWSTLVEFDLCFGLILLILYGLFTLRNQHVSLNDVNFFCRCWPFLVVAGYLFDTTLPQVWLDNSLDVSFVSLNSFAFLDLFLAFLIFVIMFSFRSFESMLLLMLAFVGQLFMLHSCDLVSFYICLEAQNFCFLVLCGLQTNKESSGFSVEATLKFLLLSAFSTGVLLFWFSALYLRTGMTSLFFKGISPVSTDLLSSLSYQFESFQILCALMFKLGAAPLHLWVVDIYGGVKRQLLMFISTAPKLCLFGFWVNSWHGVWTDFTLALFVLFTLILGSIGAYGQPGLRSLFAYSTINEIGLMLMAIETAGFHSLFQHLGIYMITQILLWNLEDKRFFSLIAVSLAGLPPLAGFFGKAWIFWHAANTQLFFILIVALATTLISLVYYLRVIRLFWSNANNQTLRTVNFGNNNGYAISLASSNAGLISMPTNLQATRHMLIAFLVILLIVLPIFVIKPFVL